MRGGECCSLPRTRPCHWPVHPQALCRLLLRLCLLYCSTACAPQSGHGYMCMYCLKALAIAPCHHCRRLCAEDRTSQTQPMLARCSFGDITNLACMQMA